MSLSLCNLSDVQNDEAIHLFPDTINPSEDIFIADSFKGTIITVTEDIKETIVTASLKFIAVTVSDDIMGIVYPET